MKKDISAQDLLRRIYPEEGRAKEFSREITFCTTHRCSLRCFPKNTLILSDVNSYVAIEDLKVGDEILGYIDNKIVKTRVTHIFINQDKLRLLKTEKSSIFTTDDHPFLLDDNMWKNAKNLKVQDTIKLYINDKIISDKVTANALTDKFETVYNIETDCHTFIANNFIVHNCTYCYQGCKENKDMTWDTAKKIVDNLFKMYDDNIEGAFITKNTKQIILDFIGGEPLLMIDLMERICDYFWSECIKRNHEWTNTFMISMASNGTEYFKPECQRFFLKYRNHLSYSVSIDGPQEMHDACRVFPNGEGSFKYAYAALQDYNKKFHNSIGTKATLARANLSYLSTLIKYYVNEGFEAIHANCVYEEEWNYDDAKLFYNELKKTADYLLSLDKDIELSLFDNNIFKPMDEEDNNNWCWGAGTPILTAEGYRSIEDIKIGDMVYTEDGSIHPVTNTMSHFADNVVEIKASGMLPMICTTDHKIFAKPWDYLGNKGKKHYKNYDRYSINDLCNSKDLILLGLIPRDDIKIDTNIAYLLGRFVGDGWVTTSKIPAICCGFSEYDELKRCFDLAGISYHVTSSDTTYDFYATKLLNKNNRNYDLFRKLASECGKGAPNKHFPSAVYRWDNSSLQALIDGYISADGYNSTINNHVSHSIGTSSLYLANDLMLILRLLGYKPTCSHSTKRGTLKIFNREVLRNNFYSIYWFDDSSISRYYKAVDDKLFTSRLSKKPAFPQLVYNITVDENHSYIAGSIVSSNCGGTGAMLGYDVDGKAYPCVRYMPASIGEDLAPKFLIGNADNGIYNSEESKLLLEELDKITRRSQSTDECFYCPIASGCSWCSAWDALLFGTPNKRCTRICVMHKARSLANVYYWNKKALKDNNKKYFHRYLPDKEALLIISNDELSLLNHLEKEAKNCSDDIYNKIYMQEQKVREYLKKHNESIGLNDIVEKGLHK